MSNVTPLSPLMQPVQYDVWSMLASMDTVKNSEYDMAHAATLAKRILGIYDLDELHKLLSETIRITSHLLQARDAAYFVYMCLETRLGIKIERLQRREEERAGRYEKGMYEVFKKDPHQYIPGAMIVAPPKKSASRPDFFLKISGVFSVAEFKAHPFRHRHLYQLQEYMEHYEAEKGFAVAPELSCDLPPRITFVKMIPGWTPRRSGQPSLRSIHSQRE